MKIYSTSYFHSVTPCSLINSIVKGRAAPTLGEPEETSTVGIELRTHEFGTTTVEFYDCAGQLDYAGMHQTFLSSRALYLLVWDVKTCQSISTNKDLDKVRKVNTFASMTSQVFNSPQGLSSMKVSPLAHKCSCEPGIFPNLYDCSRGHLRMLYSRQSKVIAVHEAFLLARRNFLIKPIDSTDDFDALISRTNR